MRVGGWGGRQADIFGGDRCFHGPPPDPRPPRPRRAASTPAPTRIPSPPYSSIVYVLFRPASLSAQDDPVRRAWMAGLVRVASSTAQGGHAPPAGEPPLTLTATLAAFDVR